ncbi:unnamed protein product [Albugo candida]|uniref:Uncharacterized protein n=1 Tax=Albugo candida TaxID=65357 RepID=A0A024FY10_9STRA|nr:unnamed protein product [Albugo candida]|eukprot:CCI11534.1 unnamed protein product [Albugo candida]
MLEYNATEFHAWRQGYMVYDAAKFIANTMQFKQQGREYVVRIQLPNSKQLWRRNRHDCEIHKKHISGGMVASELYNRIVIEGTRDVCSCREGGLYSKQLNRCSTKPHHNHSAHNFDVTNMEL